MAASAAPSSSTGTSGPDIEYSCHGPAFTPSRSCDFQTQHGWAPIWLRGIYGTGFLNPNSKVLVTCYYFSDNPIHGYLDDGVQDHVTWTEARGDRQGHLPDPYVNQGDANPWDSPYDSSPCG